MSNEFLVSVADVVIRNATTGVAIAIGKANVTSAFTLSMQAADVRAGINNPLLYSYYHTREMSVKIEQATFDETILALNVGATIGTGTYNVAQTECVQLTDGSGVVTLTPVGDVSAFLSNGNIVECTPSTKSIYVTGGSNQAVTVAYTTAKAGDQITVASTTPPSIVDLTLIAEIRASDKTTVSKYFQIHIPRFQVAGNYTLNLAANGVSTQALEGRALVTQSTDCTSGEYYAKISYLPVTTATSYSAIASLPSAITFTASTAGSSQLTVYGIRGGAYDNGVIASANCTFSKIANGSSGSSKFGVTAGGLVYVLATGASSDSSTIQTMHYDATSGSLFDYSVATVA